MPSLQTSSLALFLVSEGNVIFPSESWALRALVGLSRPFPDTKPASPPAPPCPGIMMETETESGCQATPESGETSTKQPPEMETETVLSVAPVPESEAVPARPEDSVEAAASEKKDDQDEDVVELGVLLTQEDEVEEGEVEEGEIADEPMGGGKEDGPKTTDQENVVDPK